jgi:aspartate racemase
VEHILGKEQVSPAGALVQVALFLERAGVRILAMPCVTAHYYFDEIREQTHIPLLNMIEETGKYLQERQITKAGVLCTEGTIRAGHLEKGLRKYGIEVCYPKHRDQDRVNDLIFNRIKKNGSVSDDVLASVTDSLKKDEAQVVLLACTDLSAIDHQIPFSPECTDMMEIYAKAVVREIRALCI